MSRTGLIEREEIYNGRIVRLSRDQVRLPNGSRCELEMIRHMGAAAVAPVTEEGDVLLVRQYRYATGGYILEAPAGKLDPGEEPAHCAEREVEEETGYRIGRLVPLGWIWTTPGFTDEKIWLYLALDLELSSQQLQDHEVLTLEKMPLAQAADKALSGEIVDSKTVCTLLRARSYLMENS